MLTMQRESPELAVYLDRRAARFQGQNELAKPETSQRRAASLDLGKSIELKPENLLILHRAAADCRRTGDHEKADSFQKWYEVVLARVANKPAFSDPVASSGGHYLDPKQLDYLKKWAANDGEVVGFLNSNGERVQSVGEAGPNGRILLSY